MLTLRDCIDYIDLTEEEVDAIAEHEHIPTLVAAELGNYLVESPDGVLLIRRCIIDDIAHARQHGDERRVLTLTAVLKHFVETHPLNAPPSLRKAS